MSYPAETVVILGLGLIGGSLARALRQSGFSKRFIGYGHREPSLRRGVELGVIDDFTLDLDEAIGQADILVVCTPTLVAADMLQGYPAPARRRRRTGDHRCGQRQGQPARCGHRHPGHNAAATGAGPPHRGLRAQWRGRFRCRHCLSITG